MTRHIPRLSAMEREMTYEHWLPNDSPHSYSWRGVDVEVVAAHYNVKPSQVRQAMKRIAKRYPKPETEKQAKIAAKHDKADVCASCGEPIIWIGGTPCNLPVVRIVDAVEGKHTGRVPHRDTCPRPHHWNADKGAGIEASQVG